MKKRNVFGIGFLVAAGWIATPAFAQIRGVGLGVGGQVQSRGDIDVRTPPTNVNANTDAAAVTRVNTGAAGDTAQAHGHADVAANIQSDPKLSAQVNSMLPKGESVTDAATGFKDQGQFLAALHVSQNTNISFDQLKAKMTGSSSLSLDAAIKQARPEMSDHDARDAARKGQKQAKNDGK